MNIKGYFKKRQNLIDKELDKLIPEARERPQVIHRAMRYALKGGKRVRPILCLACAEAVGGNIKPAIKTSCAIEMIHTYSLVHDDLPSMDDDDYRRGRLTCHKKFGTANAILTGDALLTLAFGVLSEATPDPKLNTRIVKELSRAASTFGMIGGQAVDISEEEKDFVTMDYINIHKTGSLIAASCKAGAIAVNAKEKEIKSIFRFGEYIGLVFQIVDDILDRDGIAKIYEVKGAYQRAAELTAKAKHCISYLGAKNKTLYALADFMLNRSY